MSDVIDHAVSALNEKLGAGAFDGTAKFVIEDEGRVEGGEVNEPHNGGNGPK